jgi:hypothetical protein
MKLLITPAEVVARAFASDGCVRPSQITPTEIVAAQERYFVPVFGPLFSAMLQGEYPELVEEWIKPSLAEFVKSRVVMTLGTVTASGVVSRSYDGGKSATPDQLVRVSREAFERAKLLRNRAVEIIEATPSDYPEYDALRNILHRTRLAGGIVI